MRKCSVLGCDKPHHSKGYCRKHYQRVSKYGSPEGGPTTHAPPETRFWRGVIKGGPDDCWIFTRGPKSWRYGRFAISENGETIQVSAHRYSYEIHKGAIPDGLVVMHSCDTPRCVNPAHLSVGTHKDNTADMIAKGRRAVAVPKGERHFKSKLNEDLVREIRASDEPNTVWAKRLGLGVTTIREARTGKKWKHVK